MDIKVSNDPDSGQPDKLKVSKKARKQGRSMQVSGLKNTRRVRRSSRLMQASRLNSGKPKVEESQATKLSRTKSKTVKVTDIEPEITEVIDVKSKIAGTVDAKLDASKAAEPIAAEAIDVKSKIAGTVDTKSDATKVAEPVVAEVAEKESKVANAVKSTKSAKSAKSAESTKSKPRTIKPSKNKVSVAEAIDVKSGGEASGVKLNVAKKKDEKDGNVGAIESKKANSKIEMPNTKLERIVDIEHPKKNRRNTRRASNGNLKKKLILSVVGVLLVVVIGFALRYMFAYNGFLNKVTGYHPERRQYSVAVMEEGVIQNLNQIKDKHVGFIKTDSMATKAEQHLQTQVSFDADYYDNIDIMMDALASDIANAMVLESDRLEMFNENEDEFAKRIRVIYTFEIESDDKIVDVVDKEITAEPFTVLISGSDSRTGVKTTARSDVNIVAVVNPKESKILLVSIPRDTYVQLHNTTGLKDKLTHAGVYGIDMSKNTIEDFLGIEIDYTIKVSFETVIKTVDQLDGIDIESDREMNLTGENGARCHFTEGIQHVDGNCALRFARERKSYETGDRHRGENQQQVITSIIGRLGSSRDYLLRIPTILDIAGDSFETTFSRDNVSSFVRMQLLNNIKWQVESIAVDGTGTYEPTYSMGANRLLYVMIPSEETVKNARNKIYEYLGTSPTTNKESIKKESDGETDLDPTGEGNVDEVDGGSPSMVDTLNDESVDEDSNASGTVNNTTSTNPNADLTTTMRAE